MRPTDSILELRGVSKSFGETTVLHGVDLDVFAQTTTALIGPSGSGKSTLLRLMNGLLSPDLGEVRFDSQLVDSSPALELRRRMGYVIQDGGLFPHLTASRNVTLLARHLRWSEKRIEGRLDELVDLTHFPRDGLDRYPSELSGGQRQRVGLMRALMLNPDVLLLDEPLGALDPLIRSELQEELRQIFVTLGKTVVIVTHDLAEAAFFADRLALCNHGRIVQIGSYSELVNEPAEAFVTRFVQAQRALTAGSSSGDAP